MGTNVKPPATQYSPESLIAAAAQSALNAAAGWPSTHLAASATTLLVTGPGVLHSVNVNTKGTVASTVKLYDGLDATGTLLASIDSLNLSGPFVFDVAFTVGLTIVITGTAAPDVTVAYRAA